MTDQGTHTSPIPDEAARLFEAAQEWARRAFGEAEDGRISTGSPECKYCPICQLIALLRGDHPEVVEKVTEITSALVASMKEAVDGKQGEHAAGHHRAGGGTPNVQKIDLSNRP